MRPIARILSLALLAALLVAGCGSGSGGSSGTTSGAETSPAGTSTAPEAPTGVRSRACRNTTGQETLLLRVTGVGCAKGAGIAALWRSNPRCRPAAGQSRSACSVEGFRCLTTTVGRGLAVTCARPERSIAFIVERG